MSLNNICTDFLEIVTGTNNRISLVYKEAAKNVDESTPKAMGYLKNFITSIEAIAAKENVKDSRISGTKGNITSFAGYDNIKTAMEFLEKNLGKIEIIKDLSVIYNTLKTCQPQYSEGYDKNVRLIVLEYESALYLLVTGLSMSMADSIDVVQNGVQLKIQKKNGSADGPTMKTIHELAKQLGSKSHKEYLDEMLKGKEKLGTNSKIEESVAFMESTVADTIDLIDAMINNVSRIASVGKRLILTVKNSIFGIIPLIRSILYLRYKKKADTILALDQQVQFIHMNIEQLQNIKNMDPAKKAEIIKKQKACAEQYQKKAAKLRAELSDGEREAADAIKKEDPEIKKVNDGEFVLENGFSFHESAELSGEEKMPDDVSERYHKYDDVEKELKVTIPTSIKLGVALKSPVLYSYGSSDIPVDILDSSNIKSSSKSINEDLKSRKDADEYSKYLPVVAVAAIADGDFDVIASNGKMMYYSHDTKKPLSSHGLSTDDPEKFFFVDSPQVDYDKNKKPTYVGKKN